MHAELFVFVEKLNKNHCIAFYGRFIPKRLKSSQNLKGKNMPFVLCCHGNGDEVIILIMISNNLQ